MINRATFTLSDLTKEFFSTLCYVEQMQSTGLGGAGYILMVTEDGWEYLLGIEGYDEHNPQNTVPLLTPCEKWDKEKCRIVYCIENEGWTYVGDYATNILIRNDLYEKINRLYYDSEHRKLEYGDCYKLLQCVLKPKYGLRRKVYTKTQEYWDTENRDMPINNAIRNQPFRMAFIVMENLYVLIKLWSLQKKGSSIEMNALGGVM